MDSSKLKDGEDLGLYQLLGSNCFAKAELASSLLVGEGWHNAATISSAKKVY